MKEAKYLLEIIRKFIQNQEDTRREEVDEEKLYHLAKKNRMNNFLIHWAQKNCESEKIKNMIQADYNEQILRDTNENVELEDVLNLFETAGIKTLIVKGVIMKDIYPQNYMRQMCDIDIMVEEKDFKLASKTIKELGYSEFYDYEKHLTFSKKPFMIIEMHKKLLLKKDVGYEYFNNVWTKCCPYKNYKNIVQLNVEDAYIFCILHLMLHFKFTGIQVRDILDVYLYNEKYKSSFDYEKLNRIFDEFHVTDFEKNIREIAYKWFGNNEKIENFDDIEKFILKGASLNNNVNYQIGEKNGKFNYLLRLFFPKYKSMKEKYPFLEKAPILLPITWGIRIIKDIFSKETTIKERMRTMKLIQDTKQEDIDYIHQIYDKLGITRKEE